MTARMQPYLDGIMTSLRGITQALRLSSSVVQDELGITGAQLFVLQQLAGQPVSSMRELERRTFTDQSSVSVVVARLVAKRHVTRRRSKDDARRIELALTASGRALVARAPALAQATIVASLQTLAFRDLRTTADALARVARDLGGGTPQMFFEPPAKRGRKS